MKEVGKRFESEGEELIRLYLEENDIKFEQEKEIHGLMGDNKPFRKADFYLSQFKVYIEFFGQWNVGEKHQERYRAKKEVYKINNIPCIYLYPENLGILDFVFKRRLKEELEKHSKLKWQKARLNYGLFIERFGIAGIAFILLLIFVPQFWWKVVFGILLLLQIYDSLKKSFWRKIKNSL